MNAARAAVALLLLVLLAACSLNPVDCEIRVIASMPLEVKNGLLLVRAGINGQLVTLLVDTGANRTALSEEATARLHLERDPKRATHSAGVGGTYDSNDAIVSALVLGGKNIPMERISVGQFRFGPDFPVDGVLGADILLGNYIDVDIDVPARTMTLYHARTCPDVTPPWHEPWARVDGVRAIRDRLLIPITVDGVEGMGILDTGAQATTLGATMAARVGVTPRDLASDRTIRVHGAGAASPQAWLHRFHTLQIGPALGNEPLLAVLPNDIPETDALVGETFVNGHRVWMSWKSRTVFIATAVPVPPPPGLVPGAIETTPP